MSRIDGNVTDLAPRRADGTQTASTLGCWMCQTSLSHRAAFCHECGTVQAPRALDHFVRLGLDSRFDIELAQLDSRFQTMARIFESERFAAKGPRQKQLALDHMTALEEANTVLRDPVRRAEYLLTLLDEPGLTPALTANSNDLELLRAQLHNSADTATIDKVAFQAGRGIENGICDLSTAFRNQSFAEVSVILARLSQLEEIKALARSRRQVEA